MVKTPAMLFAEACAGMECRRQSLELGSGGAFPRLSMEVLPSGGLKIEYGADEPGSAEASPEEAAEMGRWLIRTFAEPDANGVVGEL